MAAGAGLVDGKLLTLTALLCVLFCCCLFCRALGDGEQELVVAVPIGRRLAKRLLLSPRPWGGHGRPHCSSHLYQQHLGFISVITAVISDAKACREIHARSWQTPVLVKPAWREGRILGPSGNVQRWQSQGPGEP